MHKVFFALKKSFLFFCIFFSLTTIYSQSPWATHIHSYQFGTGQTIGQSSNYFPANVLGAVNPNVTITNPASLPNEVVSLGRNGWVTVGFDMPIINGEGADFTVFENAFEIAGGLDIFDEWLIVSVSNDGNNWFTFPYDSLTGAGMAGRTPTQGGNVNYLDPLQSGGDSFDIGQLGLNQIQYVRVQDATRFQSAEKISAELDAVIALHQTATHTDTNINLYQIYATPHQLSVKTEIPIMIQILSPEGKILIETNFAAFSENILSTSFLTKGLYIIQIFDKDKKYLNGIKQVIY